MTDTQSTEKDPSVDFNIDGIYTCPRCKNTGEYLEQGDLHQSSGIVPCNCEQLKIRIQNDIKTHAYFYNLKKNFAD